MACVWWNEARIAVGARGPPEAAAPASSTMAHSWSDSCWSIAVSTVAPSGPRRASTPALARPPARSAFSWVDPAIRGSAPVSITDEMGGRVPLGGASVSSAWLGARAGWERRPGAAPGAGVRVARVPAGARDEGG